MTSYRHSQFTLPAASRADIRWLPPNNGSWSDSNRESCDSKTSFIPLCHSFTTLHGPTTPLHGSTNPFHGFTTSPDGSAMPFINCRLYHAICLFFLGQTHTHYDNNCALGHEKWINWFRESNVCQFKYLLIKSKIMNSTIIFLLELLRELPLSLVARTTPINTYNLWI